VGNKNSTNYKISFHLILVMQKKIILTADGSHTVSIPEMNVTYHSVHGAIQESRHVFIEAGLSYTSGGSNQPDALQVLEIGLGTGLNALLTLMEAEVKHLRIHYTALEPFPLSSEEIISLNYCQQLHRNDLRDTFNKLHTTEWEKDIVLTPFFIIHKIRLSLLRFFAPERYNLVYFDTFAPASQPELWTKEVFQNLYSWLSPGGVLVTYCSKGDVRRSMQDAGFSIEKLAGPPRKREMIRAIK
jgi:tRNA U34 5-methylaminomethyl-2-thiouridine-forming methyltransferase MnmC